MERETIVCSENGNSRKLQWAAFILLAIWLVQHTIWRLLDHTPPRGDQVAYSVGALQILRVWPLSWFEFLSQLNDVTGTNRPPGSSLLLTPWFALFDGDFHKVNVATVLWHALSFVTIYITGKRFFDKETGLLAAVYFVTLRVIYNFEIHPELYFMTLTPLSIYICSRLWDRGRWRWLWWLAMGSVTAFGLLCKWIFAIYLLGPMILMTVDLVQRARREGSVRWSIRLGIKLCLMLFPVALVAVFWYWPNREQLAADYIEVARIKQFTPFKSGWTWQVPFFYAKDFFLLNKFIPAFFALIGLCIAIQKTLFHSSCLSQEKRRGYGLILSSLGCFWIYTTICYQNIPPKYFFPLLPLVASIAVHWISRLRWNSARYMLVSVIFGYALFCSFWIHFAPRSWVGSDSSLPQTGGIQKNQTLLFCLIPDSWPPHTETFPQEEIADFIAKLETNDSASGRITILPNSNLFNFRNIRVALNTRLPNYSSDYLVPQYGLIRLYQSNYILTGRARINSESYTNLDPAGKFSLILNRYIERAPDWFWSHHRLVRCFQMPYTLPTVQLYRLEQPHDDRSTAALCDLWIADYLSELDTWAQIKEIWSGRKNRERAQRAKTIESALRTKNAQEISTSIESNQNTQDLFPYELLQLGALALESERVDIGSEFLSHCLDSETTCGWRAAILLGEERERKNDLVSAKTFYLRAWRMEREQPEALQKLESLALKTGDKEGEKLFKNLAAEILQILTQNRHPMYYRNAASILLQNDMPEDALWYAQQDFTVGTGNIASVTQFHQTLNRLGSTVPDYQSVPLPEEQVSLEKGKVHVFPFLNLKEGVYRLSWKHRIETESLQLSFSIDDATPELKSFDIDEHPERGEYIFCAPAWADQLRIDCLAGKAILWDFELQRIRMDLPLIDRNGDILVERHGIRNEKEEPNGGFSFITEGNQLQLDFPVQTDPRAWDRIEIRSIGLASVSGDTVQSATFTLFVSDGERNESIVFHHPLRDGVSWIPIPEEAHAYPFTTGLRLQVNDPEPADRRWLERVTFIRIH